MDKEACYWQRYNRVNGTAYLQACAHIQAHMAKPWPRDLPVTHLRVHGATFPDVFGCHVAQAKGHPTFTNSAACFQARASHRYICCTQAPKCVAQRSQHFPDIHFQLTSKRDGAVQRGRFWPAEFNTSQYIGVQNAGTHQSGDICCKIDCKAVGYKS